ncbi:MAG: hypothetical protein JAY90_11725 [Candidatus Thiodiazotropha lotti]|nr:hypothetical protein [Candidatus Thiodiazotropha lotti]
MPESAEQANSAPQQTAPQQRRQQVEQWLFQGNDWTELSLTSLSHHDVQQWAWVAPAPYPKDGLFP